MESPINEKKAKLMTNEFIAGVFFVMVIIDSTLGWINHVYVLKDAVSGEQRKGAMAKFTEVIAVAIAAYFPDIALMFHQDPSALSSLEYYFTAFIGFMVLYELRSIAAHWVLITNIKLPASIAAVLGIDAEISEKTKKNTD